MALLGGPVSTGGRVTLPTKLGVPPTCTPLGCGQIAHHCPCGRPGLGTKLPAATALGGILPLGSAAWGGGRILFATADPSSNMMPGSVVVADRTSTTDPGSALLPGSVVVLAGGADRRSVHHHHQSQCPYTTWVSSGGQNSCYHRGPGQRIVAGIDSSGDGKGG